MSKRFRVAFSFAGDRRAFVSQVADVLAGRFGRKQILYDKYHEAEFAIPNLGAVLPRLYFEEADLVVTVLSRDYENKEWCGLEWRAVFGLIKQRRDQTVMLARFDRVDAADLFGLAGYLDLDERSPEDAAERIIERLLLNEAAVARADAAAAPATARDGAAPKDDWPDVLPELDWSVADHTEARSAFAQLLMRQSVARLLFIHGVSGTGKSHLAKQFLGNAFRVPELTCGRLDFKGRVNLDAALRSFAEQLELRAPEAAGVTGQLAHILAALRDRERPTLLIFDTFEDAGEAEQWMYDNLLLSVMRARWLRVIVLGQIPVRTVARPWATLAAKPIELRPPSAQDWFEYARPFDPDLTLDFVDTLLRKSVGKGVGTVAQFLGPPN